MLGVNDIWNKSYMNSGNEMKMKKWSSQWTQFVQLRKEAWKNFRTSTGFEPVTSRLPGRCSTNWAMKPLTLGEGQWWVHMFPWKKWVLMIYEIIKSYMTCGNEMKMKKWSSQWTQFMQLRKEAWELWADNVASVCTGLYREDICLQTNLFVI